MSPASHWYVALDALADAVNPCLALLALAVPWLPPLRGRWRLAVLYVAATGLGIAGIYIVAALDRELGIWLRFGGDYSTHTAFATSLVASMSFWKRTWAKALWVILLAYLALIPVMGYHGVRDVVTSAAVALAIAIPLQFLARRRTLPAALCILLMRTSS